MRGSTINSQVYWLSNLNVTILITQMSNEIHGILFSNVQPVSGGAYQSAPRDEESFLREVVTPIYEVLRKVAYLFYVLIFLLCQSTGSTNILSTKYVLISCYVHTLSKIRHCGRKFLPRSDDLSKHHPEEMQYLLQLSNKFLS